MNAQKRNLHIRKLPRTRAGALQTLLEGKRSLHPLPGLFLPVCLIEKEEEKFAPDIQRPFLNPHIRAPKLHAVPQNLADVGLAGGKGKFLLHPDDVFVPDCQGNGRHPRASRADRGFPVKLDSRLHIVELFQLRLKGNQGLHAEFPGIDKPYFEILQLLPHIHTVAGRRPGKQ